MAGKRRLFDIEPMLGAAPAHAPARDEVSRSAYEDVRQAILTEGRNEAAAVRKTRKALRLIDSGRSADGVRLAVAAMDDDPACLPAYMAAGAGLDQLGLFVPALTFMQEALRIAPDNPLIPAVLADIAKRNGDLESAEKCARIASQIDPLNWRNCASLALILRDQGRFEEAIGLLRGQIMACQDEPILWNTLAAVLVDFGDVENAKTFAREALRLNPRHYEAMHNLGVALIDEGAFEEALELFEKSAGVRSSLSQKGNNGLSRAHALLGSGRLEEGWPAYEVRVAPQLGQIDFVTGKPRWQGEDITGKRLLLIGEQGLGDEIMFLSAIGDARRAVGADGGLTIACERRLTGLFARSFDALAYPHYTQRIGGRAVRAVPALSWDDVDLWTPMGDLARYFRPTIESFAAATPFLVPDPERAAGFKAQRAAFGDGLCVGIAWRSLLMSHQRQRFFADIEDWAPLLTAPGVTFVSLQPGETAEEEARIAARFGVTLRRFEDLDVYADLDGIAAASTALDLVVAPMNASSNLAAAAGAEVWFTAGHKDWSMLGEEAIPWYPWSRLFLASRPGAWADLYARVGAEFARFAESRR